MQSNIVTGVEMMQARIQDICDPGFADKVQIMHNEVTEIDDSKRTILFLHNLPTHPDNQHLKNGGHRKFDKLVFASHWQQEQFYLHLGVPYSAGTVLRDAIETIPLHSKPDPKNGKINIIYNCGVDRGLDFLFVALNQLAIEHNNIHVDVYTDIPNDDCYEELRKSIKGHSHIRYHGYVNNDKIRDALQQAHIFAYPCVQEEVSSLCLIEALSAGCYCVHSALGALKETSLGITQMYSMEDDNQRHVDRFYIELKRAILLHETSYDYVKSNTETTKVIADYKYDLTTRKDELNKLLKNVVF